jgi:hypothetical protein
MKKTILLAAIIGVSITSFAQKFDNVQKYFLLRQYEGAKTELEKAFTDPKAETNPEAWLWKTRIYSELNADSALSAKYPMAGEVALDAFKKYRSLQPDFSLMAKDADWRPLNHIYVASFNKGKKFFETKQWDSAFVYFDKMAYMGDIMSEKDLKKNGQKIDTLSTLYAGYAAQNSKNESAAAKYYSRVMSVKMGGADNKDLYTYVLIYYSNQKDVDNFNKALALAKEVYPQTDWDDYEIEFINKNYTTDQKIALYDKQDADGMLSAKKYSLFGDLLATAVKDDKNLDSVKSAYCEQKSLDAYKKAFAKDNTLGIAAFNIGVTYYNQYVTFDDKKVANLRALQALNANKPVERDPKKKAAADAKFKEQTDALRNANLSLDKSILENVDLSIEWSEKAYNALKGATDRTSKTCTKNAVRQLANLYSYKRDKAKGKDPKIYDAFDAKFKEYDTLFDKL